MLAPNHRDQLNGIIGKMKDAGEDDTAIRDMVGQFTAKYDTQEASSAQPAAAGPLPALNASSQAPKPPMSLGESLFPRTSNAVDQGLSYPRQAVGAGLDLLSLPGRSADALVSTKSQGDPYAATMGQSFGMRGQRFEQDGIAQSLGDTEGKSTLGKIVRSPATMASLIAAPLAGGLAGAAGLKGLGAVSAAAGGEGLASAAANQGENIAQGKAIDPLSAGIETGLSAALPGAGKLVGLAAKGTNKFLGRLAQELSGISEEALRTYGTGLGQGAKDLAAQAGKQDEIGKKLVNVLDNLDDYLPEKQIVDAALEKMPPVNAQNAIAALEASKTPGRLKSTRASNQKIEEMISDIRSLGGESGMVPAADFRALRKDIDAEIGDAFGKESGAYVTALKKARGQMAADLVETAKETGNPEYVSAMQSMAKKIQTADDLKRFLGKSASTREQRAESFIANLHGKNKTERQKVVAQMGELFGDDFLAESKMAHLAAEFGESGSPGLLPKQTTGRALLGGGLGVGAGFLGGGVPGAAVGFALSSPRLSAGMLSGSTTIANGAEFLGKKLPRPIGIGVRPLAFGKEKER